MTKERAQWLIDNTPGFGEVPRAYVPSYRCGDNPPTHPDGMTEAEDREVKDVWNTLPGSSTFMCALAAIARKEANG